MAESKTELAQLTHVPGTPFRHAYMTAVAWHDNDVF